MAWVGFLASALALASLLFPPPPAPLEPLHHRSLKVIGRFQRYTYMYSTTYSATQASTRVPSNTCVPIPFFNCGLQDYKNTHSTGSTPERGGDCSRCSALQLITKYMHTVCEKAHGALFHIMVVHVTRYRLRSVGRINTTRKRFPYEQTPTRSQARVALVRTPVYAAYMVFHHAGSWSSALPMSSLKMSTPIWYRPRSGASTTCASVGENALV